MIGRAPAHDRQSTGVRVAPPAPAQHDRPMTTGIDAVLAQARAGVTRLDPHQTRAAVAAGALLIDTRTESQRRRQGELPGALVIDRTVLEWRLDPGSPHRINEATGYDLLIIVACRQGYSSSLAAAGLRAIGLHRATDLAGGVQAWLAAGLPTSDEPADVRE
jgi:rhodanese-related sulfurtransferase